MADEPKKRLGRKLLVAAVGVATVSYVAACGSNVESSSNVAPDAGADTFASSGNLMPPEDTGIGMDTFVSSGNLMPPDTSVSDAGSADAASDAATDAPKDGSVTDTRPD